MPQTDFARDQPPPPARWAARWIGNPDWEAAVRDGAGAAAALPVFTTRFTVERPVRSAHLHLTALGVYDATLNGQPVGTAVLEPPYTDYSRRLVHRGYDVTALLRDGENTLAVEVGTGMAHIPPTPGRYQKLTRSDGPPRLLAQLEVDFGDAGGPTVIATDATWFTALGPTTFSGWYGGEDHDARRTPERRRPAVDLGPAADGPRLTRSTAPPVEVVDTLPTRAVTEPKPGVYVFDLGVNFAGRQRLTVGGPAGTRVVMRPGEVLGPDGLVVQDPDGTGGPIWDTYVLSGAGTETWRPRFRYHGLRYLQVEGLPGPPGADTVTGEVLRAANRPAGSFTCSSDLLNTLHAMVDRAVQSNMFSVLTDCPHREKLGWLEQIHLVFGPIAFGYDVADYYRELLRTVAEAQTPEGLVPDIAPEYTVFEGGFRDDPNWGGALVLVPWLLYRRYGDTGTLREHYPAMRRYADYLTGLARGHLLDHGLGDWAASDESTPRGVTATFGYLRVVETLHRIAAVLGEEVDAARYKELAARIGEAFHTAYYRPAEQRYGVGNQACDALALDLGVVPADVRRKVLDHLVADIRAHGDHFTVGEIPLPSLLRVLADAGRHDVIWDVVTRPGHPGWGHLAASGATALPEYWDGPEGHGSQNHFMLGVIDEWFTAHLAGIQQADGSAGGRDLVIRPVLAGDLTRVEAEHHGPTGTVRSAWRLAEGRLRLEVTVPEGSTATVHVPARRGSTGWGTVVAPARAERTGSLRFRVGPGQWVFQGAPEASIQGL
ncbi:family 78 glycoside hydrolase catalytic domain [Streptomyces sp. NPDC051940]|uniref:family 78 glycoside hydrolase catalytic domain n=1 Tax=Streptomyces sp. NPDC051940 TaxID=3155675 RepID=UPI00343F2476